MYADILDPTPAEKVIREVADILGADSTMVDQICKNMERELILQEWQLSALEASEWMALGAPIGLAAAIRKLTTVGDQASSNLRTSNTKQNKTPASMFTTRSNFAKSLTAAVRGSDEPVSSTIERDNQTTDDDFSKAHDEKVGESERGVFGKSTSNTLFEMLYNTGCRDAFRAFLNTPFPMSARFDRALLHSKSASDLKAHTVFKLEIGVVIAALLLGASIEMWGAFPSDSVDWQSNSTSDGGEPRVPYILALVFYTISGMVILVELESVFLNVGQLVVATAVEESKFPQFFQQISVTTAWTNGLFGLGLNGFGINVGILVTAWTMATTSDHQIILVLGVIVPVAFVIPCEILSHVILTYVGRTAFNGYLMVDNPSPKDDETLDQNISATQVERRMCQDYYKNINWKDEEVLDRSEQLKHLQFRVKQSDSGESRTIRNSKMIVPIARKHNMGAEYFPKYKEPTKNS